MYTTFRHALQCFKQLTCFQSFLNQMSLLHITYEMSMKIMNDCVKVISFDLKFESLKNMINFELVRAELNTTWKTHALFKFYQSGPLFNVITMIRVWYIWFKFFNSSLLLEEFFDSWLLCAFLHPWLFDWRGYCYRFWRSMTSAA